jgi:hypothetical protein
MRVAPCGFPVEKDTPYAQDLRLWHPDLRQITPYGG